MAPLPRWLDKAKLKATGARLKSQDPEDSKCSGTSSTTTGRWRERLSRRPLDTDYTDYADIPSFLLPLDLRVRREKEERKTRSHTCGTPSDPSLVRIPELLVPTSRR